MEPAEEGIGTAVRARVGAVLGIASALLLVAAFIWAHHWGPRAIAIVVAWAVATLAAFAVSA